MLDQITPIFITYNEAPNIERSLTAVDWAREVLVVDSFSDDETLAICSRFDNVRVVQREFDSFANQCNFALQQDIKTPWVLSMDADYIVTPELLSELSTLTDDISISGYQASFEYLINGRPLRGSLYPPRTSLYRVDHAQYQQDGHAHRVVITGKVLSLKSKIQHDDRKPKQRWLAAQKKYAKQEARKLAVTSWPDLSWPDRMRVLAVSPLLILPYTLLVRGVIFNGWPGLQYAWQRFIAELELQKARLMI